MTIEEMNQQNVPCIHETFHTQAQQTPNNTCLIHPTAEKIYTYKETQRRVLLLASEIKKTVMIDKDKKDQVVAIYLEPSPEYIIALLAILTAGCAYVPLELAYPTTMLQRVLHDCSPIAIITNVEYKGNLPTNTTSTTKIVHHHHTDSVFGGADDNDIVTEKHIKPIDPKLIVMDDNKHDKMNDDELSLQNLWDDYCAWTCKPTLDDLAFIVYSSGTTGQPKGIANSHRAPALSYKWRFNDVRDCPPQSIVACNVFFVWECVRPLLRGAAVVAIPPSIIFDGDLLSQYISTFNVTEILFTPSLFENLLNTVDKNILQQRLNTVNTIYLNGEVVSMELRRRSLSLFSKNKQENENTCCKFYNLYSISECHEVSAIDLDDIDMNNDNKMKFCPVGLPSTQIYILEEGIDTNNVKNDDIYEPMPLGEVGELYVAGPMLARGYLNLPDITSQRFVIVNGKRMYRTGDRARLLPNTGQLEILGRCDFMVKIRGYSIVLGAVEAALLEAVHLDSCVVVADEDEHPQQQSGGNSDNTEGNKHLVAYVVRSTISQNDDHIIGCNNNTKLSDWTIDPRTGACPEIRRVLVESLPHYMIPSVFIELESLPVKEVGAKLDRKALQSQSKDRRAMLRSLQLSSATHATHLQTTTALTHDSNASVTATTDDDDVLKTVARRWKNMLKYLNVTKDAPIEDIQDTVTTIFEIAMDRPIGSLKLTSDFLEEGGHSLSAARLIALLNKVFGTNNKLTVVQLFRNSASVQSISESIVSSFTSSQPTDTTTTNNNNRDISSDVSTSKEWSIVGGNGDESSLNTNDSITSTSALILKQARDDAILPLDLLESPSTHNKTIENATTLDQASNIFLTGVTGYFGSHILDEILHKNKSATVHCLVRNASLSTPDLLFQQISSQFGVQIHQNYTSRVVLVKGDLSLPQFGLHDDVWSNLASKIDFIVHCGAAVSLNASYAKLKPVNVGGTLNIIKLTHACRSINNLNTSLLYVSSNGIFPKDDDEVFFENDDIACLPDRLGSADGYGLSKWTADSLVSAAHKTLGLPTITIRYGNLGWHSKTGVGNPLDYQGMMLTGCRRLGAFPKATKGWILEVTPVDYASYALATLASDSNLLQNGSIFHCVQDGYTQSDHVYRWMCDTDGCSYRTLPFSEWKKIIEERVADNNCDASALSDMIGLMALVSGFDDNASYLSTQSLLDCAKLDSALDKINSGASSLSRKGLVNEAYYTKFFGATFDKVFDHKLTVSVPSINDQSSKTTEAVKADPASESSSPTGPLAGKVAVVTGASSGIGRAIVVSMVQAGCHVAMGARRMGELEKTRAIVAESCKGCVSKTICVSTDVTKREQVESLVETAESTLGPVDIIVNVAGCMYFTLMKNVIWDQWEQQVDVNAKGTMYGIGAVLPKMLQRGKGHIVNITSDAGRKAFAGLGIYSGSKFFVEAVSQALRLETASTGLRVTCIQPGNVATPLLSKSTDPEGLEEYGTPTGAKVLEPADIGRAVVYALTQPEWCAVNEILVEPREEPA